MTFYSAPQCSRSSVALSPGLEAGSRRLAGGCRHDFAADETSVDRYALAHSIGNLRNTCDEDQLKVVMPTQVLCAYNPRPKTNQEDWALLSTPARVVASASTAPRTPRPPGNLARGGACRLLGEGLLPRGALRCGLGLSP